MAVRRLRGPDDDFDDYPPEEREPDTPVYDDLDDDPGPEAPPLTLAPIPPPQPPAAPPGPTLLSRRMSAREFCAIERPPPEPLCGPLLYRGRRLVVAGETGAGKSSWSFQLMRAICHGDPFLGWTGAGGRGLILDFEQDEEDIEALLVAIGLEDSDLIDVISVPHGVALDRNPHERAQLEEVFADGQYDVVLLDPLFKVFGGDSTNEREAVELMRYFDFWRMGAEGRWPKHGLIVPMHARKPPPKTKFTIAEVFGSTAWVRGAEAVYGIQFLNPGYSQLHAWKLRSHAPPPAADGEDGAEPALRKGDVIGMTFTPGDGGFKRGQTRREKAVDTVRRLMSENPHGWTRAELMDAVPGKGGKGKASAATIDRCLRELGDDVRHETDAEGAKVFYLVEPDPVVEVPDDGELDRWEGMATGADG